MCVVSKILLEMNGIGIVWKKKCYCMKIKCVNMSDELYKNVIVEEPLELKWIVD